MNLDISHLKSGNYFTRILYSAMILGQAKNKKWLRAIIMKNYVCLDSVSASNNRLADKIDMLVNAFNAKFGNDWDIVLEVNDSWEKIRQIGFVHIYENITITNSIGTSHQIRDLVTVTTLDNNLHIKRVKGTRLKMNYKELDGKYLHSHLGKRNFDSTVDTQMLHATEYCIGNNSGSEVRNMQDDLNTGGFTPDKLQLYLYTLDTLASWESLEGSPHIRMSEIPATRRLKSYNNGYNNLVSDNLMYQIEKGLFTPDFDYYISENRYKVKNNSKLMKSLIEQVKSSNPGDWQDILVEHNPITGQYHPYSENSTDKNFYTVSQDLKKKYFFYRGQKKQFTIIKQKRETVETKDLNLFSLHPNLIKYVITKLESKLYDKVVRLSRAAKENSISYS